MDGGPQRARDGHGQVVSFVGTASSETIYANERAFGVDTRPEGTVTALRTGVHAVVLGIGRAEMVHILLSLSGDDL